MKHVHVCVAGTQPLLSRDGGAVQRRIIELARAQVSLGHDVVACSAGPVDRMTNVDGVHVREIRCVAPMPWRHAEYLCRVAAMIGRLSQRAVVGFHGQPEGSFIAHRLGHASVLFYDDFYYRAGRYAFSRDIYRRMLRSFDLLLPCSRFCLEMSRAFWGLQGATTSVQYNGVNLDQFRPDPEAGERERRRLGVSGPIALYVGRVNEQKGTDLLLESWPALRLRVPDATLVIAGPIGQFGEAGRARDDESWRKRIARVGAFYLGAVDESRLASVYNMADVFVMPTRRLEMFGMAAVEAQACGTPVIASDHGGLRETVPRRCGGRFPSGDAAALSRQLQRLLTDTAERAACAEASIMNARRFSWDRIAQGLERSYVKAGIYG